MTNLQEEQKKDGAVREENAAALAEDSLSTVAGGGGRAVYPEDDASYDSQFRFRVGDHAEYITGRGLLSGHLYTDGCTIIHRGFNQYRQPCYIAQGIQAAVLDGCWIDETRFE